MEETREELVLKECLAESEFNITLPISKPFILNAMRKFAKEESERHINAVIKYSYQESLRPFISGGISKSFSQTALDYINKNLK